jgi:hypothetical protein
MDFQEFGEGRQLQEYRNLSATRWGMSPAFDINISDRIVLPDGVRVIKRMAMTPFRNREYKVLRGDDTGGMPSNPSVGFGAPSDAQLEVHEKTAYACAEEIRHAYSNNNPWGFTIFNALTGLDAKVVSGILRAVLPKPLPLPEMIEYLQAVSPINIAETEWPQGELARINGQSMSCADLAESVRAQLLEGAGQAQDFASITLDETDEEIHQKASGGKGKARADGRDRMLAESLNRSVPTVRPKDQTPVAPVAPTINPQLETALAIFLEREANKGEDTRVAQLEETVNRLTATIEQLAKPKGKKED